VTLNLYLDANCDGIGETLVGTVINNAAGEFVFNDATVLGGDIPNVTFWDGNGDGVRQVTEPQGILPNRCYEIRIETTGNFGPGDPLDGFDDAVQTLFVTRRGGGLGQRDNNGAERAVLNASALSPAA